MNIEQNIKNQFLQAYKMKDMELKDFLGIVKSEMETLKKNLMVETLSDAESAKVLKKLISSIETNLEIYGKSGGDLTELLKQKSILESFLPQEMSEGEISQKIDELLTSGVNTMGAIMKAFDGISVNRKVVSEIAKQKMATN